MMVVVAIVVVFLSRIMIVIAIIADVPLDMIFRTAGDYRQCTPHQTQLDQQGEQDEGNDLHCRVV
jgi:hypothetical protein